MSLDIVCVSIDTHDPDRIATFWEEALGWRRTDVDSDEVALNSEEGQLASGVSCMLFLRVPDDKTVKNRVHLDLRPHDQAEEVERLEKLGARRADVGQGDDVTWIVMADPDGNEFCVLRALRPGESD